jgi:hypothetical protein
MGLDVPCEGRWGGQSGAGRLKFEETEILFRGPFRLKIPVSSVKSATADGGTLVLRFGKEKAEFLVGPVAAEKWLRKLSTPRSRIDKLGVKPGLKVGVLGVADPSFLGELEDRGALVSVGRAPKDADLVFVGMTSLTDLPRLSKLRTSIKKNGAIWVLWPKGVKAFREDDVRAYGPRAGLVDVKVVSFSDVLSGLKMVIPVALR